MGIFANINGPTTVRNAFLTSAAGVHRISLAAPFFSYPDIIEEIGTVDRVFSILVRLGPATPAEALRRIKNFPNVHLRFFTSSKFHSKLYIFGDRCALVGSANLTQSGLQSNREIAILVTQKQPEFDELVSLFQSYWNEAHVLDEGRLKRYLEIWARRSPGKSPESELEDSVRESFGDVAPSQGVQIGMVRTSADQLFLEDYRRSYQEFLLAFRELEAIYEQDGRRQQPGLPLRIEIDQFFSFIREWHCPGEKFLDAPLRSGGDRRALIKGLIGEWHQQRWEWLDEQVVTGFPRINERLGTKDAIAAASMDTIIDALEVCHSFRGQLRFHLGGAPTVRTDFARSNDLQRVKNTLTYLLHGNENFVDRMGAAIFDPSFKLAMVGRSVVQELLGWVNQEDIPICNGRTMKSLRFLGYNLPA